MYSKPSTFAIFVCLALYAEAALLQTVQTVPPRLAQTSPPLSIHAPGDSTLHGNPQCGYWLRLDDKVKEVWIKAILSPINMGYMYREKPVKDKYLALASMMPAINFVDAYCTRRNSEVAMHGAMRYFEELTAQP